MFDKLTILFISIDIILKFDKLAFDAMKVKQIYRWKLYDKITRNYL